MKIRHIVYLNLGKGCSSGYKISIVCKGSALPSSLLPTLNMRPHRRLRSRSIPAR
jgi:hypothetical protein